MKTYTCEECGDDFRPSSGRQRFCRDCLNVTLRCENCGVEFVRARIQWLHYGTRFCSRSCSTSATAESRVRRGAANNMFNGGFCFHNGRWLISCRDGKSILFSRAVMEAHLRRPLTSGEIVHHVNRDTADDRIENLELTNRADHLRIHHAETWVARKAKQRGLASTPTG